MRQLAHLVVCVVGVGAATAIGMTRVVGAQGPPTATLVPCGGRRGHPRAGLLKYRLPVAPPAVPYQFRRRCPADCICDACNAMSIS